VFIHPLHLLAADQFSLFLFRFLPLFTKLNHINHVSSGYTFLRVKTASSVICLPIDFGQDKTSFYRSSYSDENSDTRLLLTMPLILISSFNMATEIIQ